MAKRRRAHLFGIGETKRRRRRSTRSRGWSGVDTVMTIGALGAVGFGLYYLFTSGKGIGEAQQTAGDWAKNIVDAVNSSGEWIGHLSYDFQQGAGNVGEWFSDIGEGIGNWSYGVQKGFGDAGESMGNAGCWAQKFFNPAVQCRDLNAGKKVTIVMLGGVPTKENPKLTNNVYNTMVMRMGVNPALL